MAEAYASAKTISSKELDDLLKTAALYTIVVVEDACAIPYVLVGEEDPNGFRCWIAFNGESKAELAHMATWYVKANELYHEKARSVQEMDKLRKLLVATATIAPYIHDEGLNLEILAYCTEGTAREWYREDHPDNPELPTDPEEAKNCSMPYIQLANIYITRFVEMMASMTTSMAEFKQAQKAAEAK